MERSILDVFVTCQQILPFISKMVIDEQCEHALTNFSTMKNLGRVIESDHNVEVLEVNLVYSDVKKERIKIFDFKNKESQNAFKILTSQTTEFSSCFDNKMKFEDQALKWRKVLDNHFQKAFKKIRISSKVKKKKKSEITELMDKRSKLKKKIELTEDEEEEMLSLEKLIANKCEEKNLRKVVDNFGEMEGEVGVLNHQGVWKNQRKLFPKIKPNLPVAKKNLKKQLITNADELKELYLNTFKYRLRHIPAQPGYEENIDLQEELFRLRLELAKDQKSPPWKIEDLNDVLKNLKAGKCRDPEGLIREIFKDEIIGSDLKNSLLILFNKIKDTGIIPSFMRVENIYAIYKGQGEISELDSDRGILLLVLELFKGDL